MRIHVLDVDAGGNAEEEGKNILRRTILSRPDECDSAWNTLIATAATFASHSQSANRQALGEVLLTSAIGVRAPRSLQADIGRLREHTRTILTALEDFSQICVADQRIRVIRPVISEAQAAAEQGHLLVLGVPGAGKSGALHDLANALIGANHDVVLFAVDQIEAASLGTLRSELNLSHEIAEVPNGWTGTGPAYLIIDALDAARTNRSIDTLLALINSVIAGNSRWRVVASVRKFDLRYNMRLRQLFRGQPSHAFFDAEFAQIHHVNVPELSEDELQQVKVQCIPIANLITQAPPALADLLRIPFNLRLLADLFGAGVSATELQPIRTQPELLDRYWTERVIRHDHFGDARETLLRRTTTAMVNQRSLRIARNLVMADEAARRATLHDLLSTQILAEWPIAGGAPQRSERAQKSSQPNSFIPRPSFNSTWRAADW